MVTLAGLSVQQKKLHRSHGKGFTFDGTLARRSNNINSVPDNVTDSQSSSQGSHRGYIFRSDLRRICVGSASLGSRTAMNGSTLMAAQW